MDLQRFSSITHLHFYAIVNTVIKFRENPQDTPLRLLDVGCGNGMMLSTLVKELALRNPGIQFEFAGLDVNDSQVQEEGYFDKTISLLASTASQINWTERLHLIKSTDPWPFPDDYFHIILSNQVLEHVFNQAFLMKQVHRTLQKKGYSFHLYPLRHYIYEGHLHMPFVHKFRSWTMTYHWIKWCTYLGMGTYKIHKKQGLDHSLDNYAERHADYLAYQVNYQTVRQVTNTARECRLKPSFDFTYLYYLQKLRSLLRMPPLEEYRRRDMASIRNIVYFFFLKYFTGITLVLRKNDKF